ncbi:CLUMA_CG017659, isoform A [Clunio marinus]|uniref:CLUMA_CG017659, isoform A n=1 Tax=Clunio marinus TaxID=568069 RepID=A0A1J1IWQ8_9DIPT|nr:CLUMA_CG017659, isoform A [Clunio marinus]
MDESDAIGLAIYDLPWYQIKNYDARKYLLLTLLRSQRPIKITAGKFFPVNLQSYFGALKAAYAYCTVLLEAI